MNILISLNFIVCQQPKLIIIQTERFLYNFWHFLNASVKFTNFISIFEISGMKDETVITS